MRPRVRDDTHGCPLRWVGAANVVSANGTGVLTNRYRSVINHVDPLRGVTPHRGAEN